MDDITIVYLLVFILLYIVSKVFLSKIFIKMDIKSYKAYIPFYNLYLIIIKLYNKKLYFVLLLIPVINLIMYCVMMISLARAFNKNYIIGILLVIFPPIMLGFIALDSSVYLERELRLERNKYV